MSKIIGEDLVQERIDKYVKDHHDEIIGQIDKKIETKVNQAIKDIFNYGWHKTPASKIIDNKVLAEIEIFSNDIEIDKGWISDQINKKVKTAVKNIEVEIKN